MILASQKLSRAEQPARTPPNSGLARAYERAGGCMKPVYVVGTADTKGDELAYLSDRIRAAGGTPLRVDVGTRAATTAVDVSASEVAGFHPGGADVVFGTDDRGTAVAA